MAVMSYTTVEKIQLTFRQVSSRTSITSSDISEIGWRAEAEINAKIGKRYTLPFGAVPPIIETLATEIACQKILEQRVFTMEKRNDSDWPKRFDRAQELLDEIATGKVVLVAADGSVISERTDQAEAWSNNKAYLPTFTEDAEINHVQDPDKIDDLRADRDQFYTR